MRITSYYSKAHLIIKSSSLYLVLKRGRLAACKFGKWKRHPSTNTANLETPLPLVSPSTAPAQQEIPMQTQQPSSKAVSSNNSKLNSAMSNETKPQVKVKPQIRLKPSTATACLDTQSEDGTAEVTSENAIEETYYNTMVLTAKVEKDHLKEYIATSEENQELEKQYKVSCLD